MWEQRLTEAFPRFRRAVANRVPKPILDRLEEVLIVALEVTEIHAKDLQLLLGEAAQGRDAVRSATAISGSSPKSVAL